MNIFRFIADMLHLAAILTLLYRIKVSRNVVGKYSATHPLLNLNKNEHLPRQRGNP